MKKINSVEYKLYKYNNIIVCHKYNKRKYIVLKEL